MNRTLIDWTTARKRAKARIIDQISPCEEVIMTYGVPRGGINVAQLLESESNGSFKLVDTPEEAHIIVDDLIDSGKTMRDYTGRFPAKPFLTLFDKQEEDAHLGWIVMPWETEEQEGGEDGVRRILQVIGEDPDREGLVETPKRFIKALKEMTQGYNINPIEHLNKSFTLEDSDERVGHYDELILSGPLPFTSLCEHHIALFEGHAWIGYIPQQGGRVVGLSKLARLLDGYAQRLQVQERLTIQIANDIEKALNPLGVVVVLKGRHTCQCARGVKKEGRMITSALRGIFKDDKAARAEALSLIAQSST